MPEITLSDQVACIEREIGFREKCYPRWVAQGKLTQAAADLEFARMGAVLKTVRDQADAIKVEQDRICGLLLNHLHSSTHVRVCAKIRGKV